MANRKKSGKSIMVRNAGAGAAYARLLRSGNFNPAIVYVEGISDTRFYKWVVDNNHVKLMRMDGKEAAMEAVARANKRGIIAIVDSDFDHLLNLGPDKNVIRTDTHDIETLMLSSGIALIVRDTYLSEDKLEGTSYTEDDVWNAVIDIGKQIGKLRLLSIKHDLWLNFDDVEKELEKKLIKMKDGVISFDIRQYVYECVHASSNCPYEFKKVYSLYGADKSDYDEWQICRGHDLSEIISIIYSKGFFGRRDIKKSEVEDLIYATYVAGVNKFRKTQMYRDIIEWQSLNKGWKILNDTLM